MYSHSLRELDVLTYPSCPLCKLYLYYSVFSLQEEKKAIEAQLSIETDVTKQKELHNKLDETDIALIKNKKEAQDAHLQTMRDEGATELQILIEKRKQTDESLRDNTLAIEKLKIKIQEAALHRQISASMYEELAALEQQNAELAAAKAGSKEELNAKIKDLEADSAIKIAHAKGDAILIGFINEKLKNDKEKAENEYLLKSIQAEKISLEVRLQNAKLDANSRISLKQELLQKEFDLIKANHSLTIDEQTIAINEIKRRETEAAEKSRKESEQTANEKLKIEQQLADDIKALDKKKAEDKKQQEKQEAANAEAQAKKQQELAKQVGKALIEIAKQVSDAIFENEKQNRDNDLKTKLDNLNAQKDAELLNTTLTASQRRAIEKKYKIEEAQEKEKAWKADQKAKAEQAIINGLLALTMSLAQQGYPAGLITGLMALAQAGVQAGIILSKTPPKFAKGVVALNGPGTETSDSIPAYLSKGESVITAKATKQYAPLLKAMNAGTFSEYMPIPQIPDVSQHAEALRTNSHSAIERLDYEKLGEAFAKKVNLKQLLVNIDEKGFSKSILSKGNRIESYNNKMKF